MFLEDINAIVVGGSPYQFIQNAVTAAASAPFKTVIIPATYAGTDTYTNPSNVPVLDLRPVATNAGFSTPKIVSGNVRAISASVSSAVTAATGGVFANTAGTQT